MRSSASFQSVITAIAVDDGHALIQGFDDLAAPVLFFEPVHMGAVRAIGEIQRHRDHRQHFPDPVIDQLDEAHRDRLAPMK